MGYKINLYVTYVTPTEFDKTLFEHSDKKKLLYLIIIIINVAIIHIIKVLQVESFEKKKMILTSYDISYVT